MRILFFLYFVLSVTLGHAQNNSPKLFGDIYTYIEFFVLKPKAYPIVFAAACKKDSICVDLSNIDTFAESVYSSCIKIPISNYAWHYGYELIFGKTEQVYNNCSLFISDFNNKFTKAHQTGSVMLFSGEKVVFNYVTIMGIFLKLDEKLLPDNFSSTSIGMPNDNIKRNIAIPISIVDYYRVEKGFRLCH